MEKEEEEEEEEEEEDGKRLCVGEMTKMERGWE